MKLTFYLQTSTEEKNKELLIEVSVFIFILCPQVVEAKVEIFTDTEIYFNVLRWKSLWLCWQVHFPVEVAESGIPPVYWCTAHYVEMLLKAEVPLVHSVFKMSGFTPSQVWSVEK